VDLIAWAVLIAFEGIIGGVAVLLTLTFVSFSRMEKNVRRARMFIMADRIQRFIGAFTVGFVVLAVTFAGSFVGLVLPAAVRGGVLLLPRDDRIWNRRALFHRSTAAERPGAGDIGAPRAAACPVSEVGSNRSIGGRRGCRELSFARGRWTWARRV